MGFVTERMSSETLSNKIMDFIGNVSFPFLLSSLFLNFMRIALLYVTFFCI